MYNIFNILKTWVGPFNSKFIAHCFVWYWKLGFSTVIQTALTTTKIVASDTYTISTNTSDTIYRAQLLILSLTSLVQTGIPGNLLQLPSFRYRATPPNKLTLTHIFLNLEN
jgi:hypothetical protein